jgi:acyl-coenzyme A synthetase/AMP-(fatty) acid ligase
MVYSMQPVSGIAADVARLRRPIIMADVEDWSPQLETAAGELGAVGIMLGDGPHGAFEVHPRLSRAGKAPFGPSDPALAFELLSSGTTGPPKRIPLLWSAVEISVADAKLAYVGTDQRTAPLLMLHPLGNIAGLGYLTPASVNGQRMVLLEKFTVHGWAEAVHAYRPSRCALPPAAMRMVLESGVPREALASLSVVAVGGARLDTELHEQFEERYGIPVLTAYGATEFGGVIAHWTLPMYRDYGKLKAGSVGRPGANISLRIVDPSTHLPLGAGETGLLEALVPRVSSDWIRTTDLASLDAEGFLFLNGRADGAINRGGFKVVPDQIADVLKSHPAVADAAVVGVPDVRLGEVPVAAVELRADAPPLAADELETFARERLLSYQVPIAFRIVRALPRNASLKVSLPQVRSLFDSVGEQAPGDA